MYAFDDYIIIVHGHAFVFCKVKHGQTCLQYAFRDGIGIVHIVIRTCS